MSIIQGLSEYVQDVNQLNEDFSERINSTEGSGIRSIDATDEIEEININKKRVLLTQKSREDSDSE
jgi:hypothetical protein